MPTLDVFKADAFNTMALTAALNKMPHVPGRIGQLGIFSEQGVRTTVVAIEQKDGTLRLVPTAPRGAPATQNERDPRSVRNFNVPHIPFEDRIQADEIQNIRSFGSENELQAVQEVVNDHLMRMATSLDATLEHHRAGAIRGQILDADGSTVIHNLFTEFGIAEPAEIDFDLDNASPASGAVLLKCNEVTRGIEDALGNAPYEGVVGLCSSQFFDDLVAHPEVREAYERWQQGEWLRNIRSRRSVSYGGILFEEYRGKVGNTAYIPNNKCRFFPTGVQDLFVTYFAPANFMETVNTIGLPRYAKQAIDERFQQWVDLHTQMNPLVLCTRPEVLFRAKRT